MKSTKWMTMAAVLTLSASLAIAAPHGGKGGRGGKHGRGEMGARLFEKLNLTDAQKAQIRTIHENFRAQNKAFFESSRTTFEQFREAKKANDTARVEALKPAVERNREQMKKLRDQQRQQVLTVLTPEQRTQWEALKGEREARRGDRKQRDF
ncbi:MAG TPA: Spy/CpxP family protein refolding chaperone [Thermoanaerobaculia bacterium]|jgi:Spy/CpxP family protein refolding chaperone